MDLRLGQSACEGSVTSPSNGTNARVHLRSAGGRTYMRSPEMTRGEQHRPEVRNRHPFPGAQRVRSCDQAVLEPVVAAGTSSETG
jgi:hypothetical protein